MAEAVRPVSDERLRKYCRVQFREVMVELYGSDVAMGNALAAHFAHVAYFAWETAKFGRCPS